jgi:hypothetical protein
MLVPATWQGSVEHFYHFLMGYFVPMVRWQEETGHAVFSVRDCGPMNPWFSLLRSDSDVEIMTTSWMLQRYLTRKQMYKVFHEWDDPRRFNRRALRRVRKVILDRWGGSVSERRSEKQITLLERRSSHQYYLTGSSDAYASGAEWRSIPNISDLGQNLKQFGAVQIVDPASMSPAEQVKLLHSTDVLVGQHGAGLSNMLWMRPGTAVIEIQPPLLTPVDLIFSSLASAMELDHRTVKQDGDHAPVSPADVELALTEVQRTPGSHVPRMPGRQPLRLLRQLPRRY